MIRIGIVGISGYSGLTALELLLKHPQVRITYVSANNSSGRVDEIWPHLKRLTNLYCNKYDLSKAVANCDLLYLAVPHTVSLQITPQLLKAKIRVIDLSADYRLLETKTFKKWYGVAHTDQQNLKKAVYGLPEIYREKIKNANLIANPGCFPTAAILTLAPLITIKMESILSIIIDAKSGVSGAGRKVSLPMMFTELYDNFKAYKVLRHQHTPEIDHYLTQLADQDIKVTFVPHLLPIKRGILVTVYVALKRSLNLQNVIAIYKKFFKTEHFIRVLEEGKQPELKNVAGTNFLDIGIAISDDEKMLVLTGALDNLLKGASGQAVQNMNIMFGFPETMGLNS